MTISQTIKRIFYHIKTVKLYNDSIGYISMEKVERRYNLKSHALDQQISCPYCNVKSVIHWEGLSFWRCPSCGLVFRYPLPNGRSVVELYENSWTAPFENRSETGGTSLNLARVYARKLADSLNRKDFSGLRILDFGAGRGDALTALSELGADVYGVEPFGYDGLVEKGFKMFRTLDEIPEEFTFDGIITMDVVEHLESPWEEIKGFSRLLKEDGFIYISTPNVGSLRAKIEGEKWREAVRPGHFVLFNQDSLENMLERLGYKSMKRLRWYLKYDQNNIHKLLGYILQTVRIDGELRYLIRKS
jgi:SAM-dependent methyltransferase